VDAAAFAEALERGGQIGALCVCFAVLCFVLCFLVVL
jgi:hypothetical protein